MTASSTSAAVASANAPIVIDVSTGDTVVKVAPIRSSSPIHSGWVAPSAFRTAADAGAYAACNSSSSALNVA